MDSYLTIKISTNAHKKKSLEIEDNSPHNANFHANYNHAFDIARALSP